MSGSESSHVYLGWGPEDKVSMGSNSYVEKYNSANDTKEGLSPDPCPEPWDPLPRLWQSLKTPKKSPWLQRYSTWGRVLLSTAGAPRDTFQSWVSPKFKQSTSTGFEGAAMGGSISHEPPPPRVTSKRPGEGPS